MRSSKNDPERSKSSQVVVMSAFNPSIREAKVGRPL